MSYENQKSKAVLEIEKTPALAVETITPQVTMMSTKIYASGNVIPWQELIIGAQSNGLKLTQVLVNEGDQVKRGQLLAKFSTQTLQAILDQSQAEVIAAEIAFIEAKTNANRVRGLINSGAMSKQQTQQIFNNEQSLKAKLDAALATKKVQQLRFSQASVYAPDNGVITSKTGTIGSVIPTGQELFRMIRQNRIEWRAQVASSDINKLKHGLSVNVTPIGGDSVLGTLRKIAPEVNEKTLNGTVFVDLPSSNLRSGIFATGEFVIDKENCLTLGLSSILIRDGFSYVFLIDQSSKVIQKKIKTGRWSDDRVEILSGISVSDRVVLSGVSFLQNGDLVRVINTSSNVDDVSDMGLNNGF